MENTPQSDETPAQIPGRSPLFLLASWIRDLLVSIFLAVLVILFLYQPVKVEGTSMMPALENQERIFINKFVYRFGITNIQRGDMVVFWFPMDPTKSYIKRVIGVPGDTVEIDNGNVIVNGQRLQETYVSNAYRDHQPMAPFKVHQDEYFVMGDHRSSSNDSRSWGAVPKRYIYGKAVFVYWPLEKIGVVR